jgi:alkylhydroperoxidase/carboxymuconolactone decarboxylase family protein YurZ
VTAAGGLVDELGNIRERFRSAAGDPPALDARVAALVRVALYAHVSLLERDALAEQIRRALDAGATTAEVVETLVLTSAVGSHSIAIGVPILLEEMATAGIAPDATPMGEQHEAIRGAFTDSPVRPREWAPMWDAVLRADPDYFAALAAYLDAPWRHGTLDPVVREFIYIAVDVTATHLFPWGLRGHIRSALGMGATPRQIIAVIQIASTVADLTCTIGLPLIR